MKIAILGGAGFIATNATNEAIKRGHSVVGFDNLSRTGVKDNLTYLQDTHKDKYQFVWGDVRKRGDFAKLPKIDAIINFAANPSVIKSIEFPGYDFETNCGGVVNSLDYCRSIGNVPYIYASTNKVYSDMTNELLMTEDINGKRFMWIDNKSIDDKYPVDGYGKYGHSLYGIGKLAGELYAQEYHIQFGIPFVAFRMSCIYGLWQKGVEEQAWVDWFLRQIMSGNGEINIFGTGKQVRDVLDGRDTARAYLDALENIDKVNGEIMTLGGGPDNTYSLLETIEKIEDMTGKKAKLSFHPKRPADQDIYISSIEKVKEKLGWEPKIGLEQALKDMIREYS